VTALRRFDKALLIGLDCAVPGRWRKYAEAGLLPVGQRLLADGCLAAECLPAMPTLTTTNWATIATGAWPGTHGITGLSSERWPDVSRCLTTASVVGLTHGLPPKAETRGGTL